MLPLLKNEYYGIEISLDKRRHVILNFFRRKVINIAQSRHQETNIPLLVMFVFIIAIKVRDVLHCL